MEHLMESVRKYPCLRQLDLIEYKGHELKEAWQEVFISAIFQMWQKLNGHRQAINAKKIQEKQRIRSLDGRTNIMVFKAIHTNIEMRDTTDTQHDDSITEDESQDSWNRKKKNNPFHARKKC